MGLTSVFQHVTTIQTHKYIWIIDILLTSAGPGKIHSYGTILSIYIVGLQLYGMSDNLPPQQGVTAVTVHRQKKVRQHCSIAIQNVFCNPESFCKKTNLLQSGDGQTNCFQPFSTVFNHFQPFSTVLRLFSAVFNHFQLFSTIFNRF